MDLQELKDRFLSLLFPKRCVLCGDVVEYDQMWCGHCPVYAPEGAVCEICGKQVAYCTCGTVPWAFERAVSPLVYRDSVRLAVILLKESPDRRVCEFFCDRMAQAVVQMYGGIQFDCIVPVPMHAKKLRERGYNQAEMLACGLGERLGLPVCDTALRRSDRTLPQHGLHLAQRFENAAMSYAAGKSQAVAGKRVLLVDDVFTTGATAHACAAVLCGEGGAKSVHVLTAASTNQKTPAKKLSNA